jgi:hypothetical protein
MAIKLGRRPEVTADMRVEIVPSHTNLHNSLMIPMYDENRQIGYLKTYVDICSSSKFVSRVYYTFDCLLCDAQFNTHKKLCDHYSLCVECGK